MYIEIVTILLLLIANGIFSASEMAIVSSRKIRLEQSAKTGDAKAKVALKLARSPNNFLSTVQIGITLIGILSGAVGGATLAERLRNFLNTIPVLAPYSQVLSFGVVVTIITYLSLVIGELLPKRIALNNPEKIATQVAGPMQFLSKITAPVVYLLGNSTDLLLNLLGIRPVPEETVSEDEIKLLIEQATTAGTFEEAEQEMVSRVFRLSDRPIKALMTPRTEIDWLDLDSSLHENLTTIQESAYSRFPLCQESIDNCLGIVKVRNVLAAHLAGQEINLQALAQPPLYVAEGTRALKVLELVKESGDHMALIVDEYGGVEGLVTLNDLMEAIVGEIPSAEGSNEPMVIQRDDGSWLLDGLLSVDEFKDLLNQESLPKEEDEEYHTVGGFIISFLGKIPTSGDFFEWEGLRFEVMDMDGTRVDKVLVSSLGLPEEITEDQFTD
ncbi:hemolysin family protein [Chroococcus sp. FPU101]|uniref:hemolysin family protein n=1 Tax=Chroococcus sp. FPU101 TaxID=1974212 RepID=UPI001A9096A9|nr:hemolysin family protein [Chroococcus sp. FPU101]